MKKIAFFLVALGLFCAQRAQATHLRAGQITAVRDVTNLNVFTYVITLTLYRETLGVNQPQAELVFRQANGQAIIAQQVVENPVRRLVKNMTEELVFTMRFNFPSPGKYIVSFTEANRTADIVNIANSVNTPFHIETMILVNPALGVNNTPLLLNPPIDAAIVGQRFCHNAAAFDVDGDSLAYRLSVPGQSRTGAVAGYRSPETVGPPLGQQEAGGTPTFAINPLTGDVCWDAPGSFGIGERGFANYNIAFIVEEWRKTTAGYVKISETARDMQITVWNHTNRRPEVIVPRDTCIVAGTDLRAIIRATDPDRNQQTRISSESAIFSALRSVFPNQSPATLDPSNNSTRPVSEYVFQGNPAQSSFRWQTTCQHIRDQPYDVVFKADDEVSLLTQPFQLADIKTWRVRVVNPPPVQLQAQAQPENQTIRLTWQPYTCPIPNRSLTIWRKASCATDSFTPNCNQTAPAGYTLIGRVDATQTAFIDSTFDVGRSHVYRISAGEFHAYSLSEPTPCVATDGRLSGVITNPAEKSVFRTNATVTIQANASFPDGRVAKVEFYNGSEKLGEDNAPPYIYEWKGVPSGNHWLRVQAFDETGKSVTSRAVNITVNDIVNAIELNGYPWLELAPNPFWETLNITSQEPVQSFRLVNMLGSSSSVSVQHRGDKSYEINTGSLAPGLYWLEINYRQRARSVHKVVKH
ncbi:MAG: Ig-like domain-containing protein [Cytophagales bacterium]|jgi:hypothetical protein|nr:Ig-like domain-containing protein [Cytophagales bacterium]